MNSIKNSLCSYEELGKLKKCGNNPWKRSCDHHWSKVDSTFGCFENCDVSQEKLTGKFWHWCTNCQICLPFYKESQFTLPLICYTIAPLKSNLRSIITLSETGPWWEIYNVTSHGYMENIKMNLNQVWHPALWFKYFI